MGFHQARVAGFEPTSSCFKGSWLTISPHPRVVRRWFVREPSAPAAGIESATKRLTVALPYQHRTHRNDLVMFFLFSCFGMSKRPARTSGRKLRLILQCLNHLSDLSSSLPRTVSSSVAEVHSSGAGEIRTLTTRIKSPSCCQLHHNPDGFAWVRGVSISQVLAIGFES